MPRIHPTAIIDTNCELAEDVEVGPYAVVQVRVEDELLRIQEHA